MILKEKRENKKLNLKDNDFSGFGGVQVSWSFIIKGMIKNTNAHSTLDKDNVC